MLLDFLNVKSRIQGEILGSRSLKSRAARRLQRREPNSSRPAFCVRPTVLNPLPTVMQDRPPAAAWKNTLGQQRSALTPDAHGPPNGTVLCASSSAEPDAEPVSSPARWHLEATPLIASRRLERPDQTNVVIMHDGTSLAPPSPTRGAFSVRQMIQIETPAASAR